MPSIPRISSFVTLLVAVTAGHAGLAAVPATRAPDPWAAVPAWPTACHSSQDKFQDLVNTARESVQAERKRQDEINKRIKAESGPGSSEDPMAQARRMQEYLMKDPQHAAEQFRAMGVGDPAATQQSALAAHEHYQELQAGDKKYIAEYEAAKKAVLGPARKRMQALGERAGAALVQTEAGDFWPEWAYKEAGVIMQEAEKTYVPFCAKWFGTGGKMPAYLQQRRNYLVNERIPALDKQDPTVSIQQMMGHNAEGYRSLAPYDAVDDYLVLAYELFGLRTALVATCVSLTNCDDQLGLMK